MGPVKRADTRNPRPRVGLRLDSHERESNWEVVSSLLRTNILTCRPGASDQWTGTRVLPERWLIATFMSGRIYHRYDARSQIPATIRDPNALTLVRNCKRFFSVFRNAMSCSRSGAVCQVKTELVSVNGTGVDPPAESSRPAHVSASGGPGQTILRGWRQNRRRICHSDGPVHRCTAGRTRSIGLPNLSS